MVSPHSPATTGGAPGLESLVSTRAALHDTSMIEDKTRTSLTPDQDKEADKDKDPHWDIPTVDKGKARKRSRQDDEVSSSLPLSVPLSLVQTKAATTILSHPSSSPENFKDVQSHPMDLSLHTDLSSRFQPVRKRKHSDDVTTARASRASTPGPRASTPSHSVSTSSTPPSSIPSMAASPPSIKSMDNDHQEPYFSNTQLVTQSGPSRSEKEKHAPKHPRVYDLDDDDNENEDTGVHIGSQLSTLDRFPIIIGDDENDEDEGFIGKTEYSQGLVDDRRYDADVSSDQVDDQDSVVEVYGGSPAPSVVANTHNGSLGRREPSPSASHVSLDSDRTITPQTIRQGTQHSQPLNRQEPSETTPHSRSGSRNVANRPVDDPEVEEILEVIDLTRPERRSSYPRGDSLPRVAGLNPQHSFSLPTLQRLVSRSSESMERSQSRRLNLSMSSVDVHEIPDDDEDEEAQSQEDRYGNDTIRIDNEVREVQLDPRHPWARGPVQLILSPERNAEDNDQYLEGQRQRQLEDAVILEDHLTQIDYDDAESESDVEEIPGSQVQIAAETEAEDEGITDQQVSEEVNWILNLRNENVFTPPPPPPRSAQTRRTPSCQARSPPFESRSYSFEARMSPFPTTSRRSATPQSRSYRFSPVARRPSPVPLILSPSPPRSRASSRTAPSTSNGASSSSRTQPLKPLGSPKRENVAVSVVDVTVKTGMESWARQNLRCSICMEVMNVPTMVRCGHAFCRGCILQALETKKICPMCRYPTTKSKLQELEFFVGGGLRPVNVGGAGSSVNSTNGQSAAPVAG